MLEHWMKPVSDRLVAAWTAAAPDGLGAHLLPWPAASGAPGGIRLVLLGVDEAEANAIRSVLYTLAVPGQPLPLADLGNLRQSGPAHLLPVLEELMGAGIIPVLFGGAAGLAHTQMLSCRKVRKRMQWVVLDERVDRPGAALADILHPRRPAHLQHIGLIGVQGHFLSPAHWKALEDGHTEVLRLGRIQRQLEEAEPLIRDADAVSLHLQVIRQSDAPGVVSPTPSGFFGEQVCQMCRYAGMSDRLRSFGIFGSCMAEDRADQTAGLAAQLIWYFLEGWMHRKGDDPTTGADMIEYVVHSGGFGHPIHFWKSKKSGRWWIQVPGGGKRKKEAVWVSCSHQDYESACREELPERLLRALQRLA
jgi:formiminoglutamase